MTAEAEKGKTMQPSEGPWRSIANFHCVAPLKGAFIKSGDVVIAEVSARNVGSQEICDANAAFIVRAVNCHADMLAALKATRDRLQAFVGAVGDITDCSGDVDALNAADAAIAKATQARAEGRTP